jgi:hypothetical protein
VKVARGNDRLVHCETQQRATACAVTVAFLVVASLVVLGQQ